MKQEFEKKIIEVCDKCYRACCWHGEFMCDDSYGAGTKKLTVAELRKLDAGEHEDYWSDKEQLEVCGSIAPYGYSL